MRNPSTKTPWLIAAAALALAAAGAVPANEPMEEWPQWGGPGHDFHAPSEGIADAWPETGPPEIWSRALGDGYSTILVEDGRLYTMYRGDDKEVVACLDAKDGKTIWEHRYDHAPHEGHVTQFGEGPRGTPLISGDRIYTIGVAGMMHSLDKKDGKVRWSHDLWEEYGGNKLPHGYSSSPIEYGDTVIALVGGGEGHGIMAFDKESGEIAWKSLDLTNSYSTPRVHRVGDKDLLITFMAQALVGLDPATGELEWQVDHANQFEQNISQPVLVDDEYLFLSSPQAGAKGLRLSVGEDGKSSVEEIWATRKIQFYHVTAVLDGEWVYGSTGMRAPNFLAAVNVKTGEIGWRERGFAKANCVLADGHLVILDEDGKLSLTTATPEKLEVHSQVELLDKVAWTVPTIVGKTLYVRDKVNIMALDLG